MNEYFKEELIKYNLLDRVYNIINTKLVISISDDDIDSILKDSHIVSYYDGVIDLTFNNLTKVTNDVPSNLLLYIEGPRFTLDEMDTILKASKELNDSLDAIFGTKISDTKKMTLIYTKKDK